jgi:hypothetical protein
MLTSVGGNEKSQPPAVETVTLAQSAKFAALLVHESIYSPLFLNPGLVVTLTTFESSYSSTRGSI